MIPFDRFQAGPLSLQEAENLWQWMQRVERFLDNFQLTPPLMGTEGRVWLDVLGLTSQQAAGNVQPYTLAQITGVTRYTTTQPLPPGFPIVPPPASMWNGQEGGQGMNVADTPQAASFAPINQYQWVPVTPDAQGGVVVGQGGSGSGVFLSTTGTTTVGLTQVNMASVTGLQVGQSLYPNIPYPTGATIVSIDTVGVTVTFDQQATTDGVSEFDFLGTGAAFEANGYVVPVGQVVRLWPGYVDPTVGQTYLFDGADRPLNVKIIGGSNPYSWQEVVSSGAGFTVPTGGNSGSATFQPLYERNGATNLAVGAYALAWRGSYDKTLGQRFIFDRSASMPTSGGGGATAGWNIPFAITGGVSPNRTFYPHSAFATPGTYPGNVSTVTLFPTVLAQAHTVGSIILQVTIGGFVGSLARAAIYADNGNGYPGALIFDTGDVNVEMPNGIKETPCAIALAANTLYWLAITVNPTASGTATFLAYSDSQLSYIGKFAETGTGSDAICYYLTGRAYAAFSNPFELTAAKFSGATTACPVQLWFSA